MTAGIVHMHGVWCGRCRLPDAWNEKGYFENRNLGRYLRKLPKPDEPNTFSEMHTGLVEEVEKIIREDGYDGGPWLLKNSVMAAKTFRVFNPVYIVPYRRNDQIFESCRRSQIRGSGMTDRGLRQEITELKRLCMQVVLEMGGYLVDTEAVAHGDFSTIQWAIEGLGLPFNAAATERFVDSALWSRS